MAVFETTSSTSRWSSDGSLSVLQNIFGVRKIVKIDDGQDDYVLEVGRRVTVSVLNADGTTQNISGVFSGTVSVDGTVYPVVFVSPTRFIVGLDPAKGTVPYGDLNASDLFVPCFFSGTLIATPSGECKVEELVSGDLVSVGESRAVPVKWIGRQTVSTLFGPADRLMPVRFAAGSLGGGGGKPLLPHSDLTVTTDHAVLIDGVLCEAGTLINGTTIIRVPLSEFGERYTVYHVETEAHEIVFANGFPAETFVDNVPRRAFDNFAEFEALHGDPSEMKELPYPRASSARHLPARIKARLGLDLRAQRPRRSAS